MGINRCIFEGRLGSDPEIKLTQSGKAVGKFSLAVDTGDKAQDGSKVTAWLRCTVWDRNAETMGQYCHKGDSITVEARVKPNEWQDKQGVVHKDLEFVVDRFHFGPKAQGGGQGQPQQRPQPPRQGYQTQGPGAGFAPRTQAPRPPVQADPMDNWQEPGEEPVPF